jgi:ABC-type enterobactin transport system permease subunit
VLFALLSLLAGPHAPCSASPVGPDHRLDEVCAALVAPGGSDAHVIVRTLIVPATSWDWAVGAALGLAEPGIFFRATPHPIADPALLGVRPEQHIGVVLSILASELRLRG